MTSSRHSRLEALPRLIEDREWAVRKKDTLHGLSPSVPLITIADAREYKKIIDFTIDNKIYYLSTEPTGVRLSARRPA